MKELFEKIRQETKKGRDLALAVIISQEGSSPRGLGAQMLVGEEGRLLGTVGGGSIELLSIRFCQKQIQEKNSCEKFFSLTPKAKENIGMVCGGDVTLWFQFIDSSLSFWDEFSLQVLNAIEEGKESWLVWHKDGSLPELLFAENENSFNLQPGEYRQIKERIFIPVPIAERAVIFGGGHCSQALAPVLNSIGFRVTVLDNREEFTNPSLFPGAEKVLLCDYNHISDVLQLRKSDYVVIMTNGHSHDFEVEYQVLEHPPVYVGAIGSQKKKDFINKRLLESGISKEVINQVHCPIGTPIKAATPEEIAISIAGEMIFERALLREAAGEKKASCPMHE